MTTLTREQACALIDYIEAMEEHVRFDSIMSKLRSDGYTELDLNSAAVTLGAIAGRTFSIL